MNETSAIPKICLRCGNAIGAHSVIFMGEGRETHFHKDCAPLPKLSDEEIIDRMAKVMEVACPELYREIQPGMKMGPDMIIEARKIFAAIRAYEEAIGPKR